MIYLPHRRLHHRGSGVLWSAWDGLSQDTLSADQDSDNSEDTVLGFHDAEGASDNDTGRGAGLTGANLVLTEIGDVPAATGTPPRRALDNSGDWFQFPGAWWDTCIKDQPELTLFFHLFNWANQDTYDALIRVTSGTGSGDFMLRVESNKLKVYAANNAGTVILNATTTDNVPTNTELWVMFWLGATYARAGFTSGTSAPPTAWSDFEANKRMGNSHGGNTLDWSISGTPLFYNDTTNSSRLIDADVACVGMSSVCLIDDAS